jgi:DNA-binding transcriptional ArsR family regulator
MLWLTDSWQRIQIGRFISAPCLAPTFLMSHLEMALNHQKILKAGKMAEWTFITNHAVVLSYLYRYASITARDLASHVGITERAVRKIIRDLADAGFIRKSREGRRVKYSVKQHLPLRHRTQRDKSVGDLLNVLGFVKEASRKKS